MMACSWCDLPIIRTAMMCYDLCAKCEKRFAELSSKDGTYAENDITTGQHEAGCMEIELERDWEGVD